MSQIGKLGPASVRMLEAADVSTLDQLHELGSVAAYLSVKSVASKASLSAVICWFDTGASKADWSAASRHPSPGRWFKGST